MLKMRETKKVATVISNDFEQVIEEDRVYSAEGEG